MKTKHILFTIALFFSVTFINAQDKYEFMIMNYCVGTEKIGISINGQEFKKDKAEFSGQEKSAFNANPLLLKIEEYQKDNWELINFHTMLSGQGMNTETFYIAYLKRKKQ